MADGVDTGMEQVQPARSFPPPDRSWLEAEPKQLVPRDHPMLSVRQLANRALLNASLSPCPYIGLSDGLARHARSVPS
jgi:hypothetical protein